MYENKNISEQKRIFVSIIIPCRNEENFIGRCLDSIIANNFSKDKVEIIVVDGMSDDKTREMINQYTDKYSLITILDNHRKIVSTALNIGIKRAKGNIIMRMDAHTTYDKDYIHKCVKYLLKYNVDNVGGVCVTLAGANTVVAESIAIALSHPFGIGNSYFRIGSKESRYVDTVPFGCYKREVFIKVGFFDEGLIRNQDDEFNLRLIKNGGKVLLIPDIVSYYHGRDSLSKLWNMYYQYGYFKPLVAKKTGAVLTWRQVVPAVFVFSLITSGILSLLIQNTSWLFLLIIVLYLCCNIFLSFYISLNKGLKYFIALPLVFAALHFSYGFGYLKGILDFVFLKNNKHKKGESFSLTR